ncbi:hypothetical protein [Devosia ginsengisoli]|uniref:hypothetical protein n=1 Tax=Devosia ginsengisoli TaxID=400770 RepID=UPI0026F0565E|nr:hypothetical protein [Devosia ginsengisoli]MCR6673287.1 hypothetical protein [Devosia ginsengisoli]
MQPQARTPIAEQIFGHNKAPLEEVLPAETAEWQAEADRAVAALADRPGKIKDETDFAATGKLVLRAKSFLTRIEDARKAETDPLYQAQKGIKAHFDAIAARVDQALGRLTAAADDYARAKAAEEKRQRAEEARKLREQEEAARAKAEAASGKTAARAEGRAEVLGERAAELEGDIKAADAVRTHIAGGGVASAKQGWDFEITDYDAVDLNKLRPYLARSAVETAIRSAVRVGKQHTSIPGIRVFEAVKAAFR